ncbi:MAG: hypothetical protein AAF547_18025 [Actinomycetota bacterium]
MDRKRIGVDFVSGLALPSVVDWPIFPFKGELSVRTVRPFADTERPRDGEPGGDPCPCRGPEDERWPELWTDGTWSVRPLGFDGRPAPFPAYMLMTVRHIDIEDFDDELAADFGRISLRLERAIRAIGSIGRVHINRWGDGGSHFHVWFLGRPAGAWQLSGMMLPLWGFTLPSLDEVTRRANDQIVASALAASTPT